MIIEGSLSTKAVLESGKRECLALYLDNQKNTPDIRYIINLAKKNNVKIEYLSKEEIASKAHGKTHGGILLEVGYRFHEAISELQNDALILCVEGVNDPFNFGQICRNAYAFGVTTLLCDDYVFGESEAILIKASAGTSERLNIVRSNTLDQSLIALKKQGVKIFGCARFDDSVPSYEQNFNLPLCVCIGGEMRGLSRKVLDQCEGYVIIPTHPQARLSLTAVNSTAVILYEINRRAYVSKKEKL